jgi:hypothetical protein
MFYAITERACGCSVLVKVSFLFRVVQQRHVGGANWGTRSLEGRLRTLHHSSILGVAIVVDIRLRGRPRASFFARRPRLAQPPDSSLTPRSHLTMLLVMIHRAMVAWC